MEFLKARVWTAVSLGSAFSLMLIGFTAVYREGFETVLFYEALLSFGTGLGLSIAIGFGLGVRRADRGDDRDLPARSAAPDQAVPVDCGASC